MHQKPVILTVACSLLFLSGCAAKNRWFSRRDYSEMQDPFMESEAIADKDAGKPRKSDSDTAGRASLGSSDSRVASANDSAGTPGTANTRSVMQTSASDAGVARTGQVSAASYPENSPSQQATPPASRPATRSWSGPALSDFLSGRQPEAANNTATGAGVAGGNVQLPKPPSPGGPKTASPAARAAALPDIEAETESFSSFLQQKSAAVSNSARQVTDAANAKSQQAKNEVKAVEESAEDFAAWASQEQQKWNQQGQKAVSTVSATPQAVRTQVKSSAQQTRRAIDDAVSDFSEFPDDETQSEARPLMKKYSQPAAPSASTKPAPKFDDDQFSGGEAEDENPFSNPFESGEFAQPTAPKSSTRSAGTSGNAAPSSANSGSNTNKPGRKLDDGFRMDSGWKPSHLEHP